MFWGKQSKETGFTLIELMIVIAIVGILASIAIPNFLKYRTHAYDVSAKEALNSAYKSVTAYFATDQTAIWSDLRKSMIYQGGFVDTDGVTISVVEGKIQGTHSKGSQTYQMDSEGKILQVP